MWDCREGTLAFRYAVVVLTATVFDDALRDALRDTLSDFLHGSLVQ